MRDQENSSRENKLTDEDPSENGNQIFDERRFEDEEEMSPEQRYWQEYYEENDMRPKTPRKFKKRDRHRDKDFE